MIPKRIKYNYTILPLVYNFVMLEKKNFLLSCGNIIKKCESQIGRKKCGEKN